VIKLLLLNYNSEGSRPCPNPKDQDSFQDAASLTHFLAAKGPERSDGRKINAKCSEIRQIAKQCQKRQDKKGERSFF
jgi:hypothetical protein